MFPEQWIQEIRSSLVFVPMWVSQASSSCSVQDEASILSAGVGLVPGRLSLKMAYSSNSYPASHFKSVTQTYITRLDFFSCHSSCFVSVGERKKKIKPQITWSGCAWWVAQNAVKSHERFDQSQYQLLSYNSFCGSPNRILILCLLFGD